MNVTIQNHPEVGPGDIALMTLLADDLSVGGFDLFVAHEREWRASPLAAFARANWSNPLRGTLDIKAIWAKRNGRNRNRR